MTSEVARDTWSAFVDEFSRRNQGRVTRLEIFGEFGAQEEEKFLPLNGVTLDVKGSDAPRIAILLGNAASATNSAQAAQHLTHTVASVTQLFPKQDETTRTDEALEIVSANGEKTLLRFVSQPNASQ